LQTALAAVKREFLNCGFINQFRVIKMQRSRFLPLVILVFLWIDSAFADDDKALLDKYRAAAMKMNSGDAAKGKSVFESKEAACAKCHVVGGKKKLAGPDLAVVGDKYTRDQIVQSVLEPSKQIHPDYATLTVTTKKGKSQTGVLLERSAETLSLLDAESKLVKIPLKDIETQERAETSLMPTGIYKNVSESQFVDLVAYLTKLRQKDGRAFPGMPLEIPQIAKPVRLEPLHSEDMRFDFPVWVIAKPGTKNTFLVVEQKRRKVWELEKRADGDRKDLFADLSHEAITGKFEGVMCLAFHPDFLKNRKYYLNYHVREENIFSPVIVERTATADLSRDKGGASKRLLKIKQPTDLPWGGMLAFGPDGYLYIGAGDGGPQEDPRGNGQNLGVLNGKILRIDVDKSSDGKPYAIPHDNPFKKSKNDVLPESGALPEIWGYGFRMPWRFSWDSKTKDMWVGDIGQNLYEKVTIARNGENHGWNVFESFVPFSNQFRRKGEKYIPPVYSYRRRDGVSVTGGYVYRGKRSPSYVGAYIFSDFESKRIWALTQEGRKLVKVRQIGTCPEKPASFGVDSEGELLMVGYQGTIYRLILDDSVFE
jgi:putative heme-binding domain-containing protein